MRQAALLHRAFLDLFPPFDDSGGAPEVDVCGRNVADALVVAVVVVMLDEGLDLALKVAGMTQMVPTEPVR